MDCFRFRWLARGCAFAVACVWLLNGCGSSPKGDATTRIERPQHIQFAFTISQQSNVVTGLITATSPLGRFDTATAEYLSVGDGDFEIVDKHDSTLFRDRHGLRVEIEKAASGITGKPLVTIRAEYHWAVPDAIPDTFTGRARLRMYYHDGTPIYDSTIRIALDPTIRPTVRLRLGIEQQSPGKYQMNMTVKRVRMLSEEYTPTSLTHDWIIVNEFSRPIWQESFGNMYAQVLTPVQPAQIGSEASYTDFWDGRGNILQGDAPPGQYRLIGIIPSKPVPASDTVNFIIH